MARHDLDSPVTFKNGVRAKNRVALAAMTNSQSHVDGSLPDDELAWLVMRADGGFGVVTTCAAHVSKDGKAWEGELGVYDDGLLPGLTRLASALRERGATSMVQLFHGGARTDPKLTGEQPMSCVPLPGDPADPRMMTTDEVERVVGDFRDAAVRAHRAGFDGVELHGAHGYLHCQFLGAHNTRADGYGGDFAGRARLLRECTRAAARRAVPASFRRRRPHLARRLGQREVASTSTRACSLARAGSRRTASTSFTSRSGPRRTTRKKRARRAPALPLFRAALPADVPLFVAGKIWSRADAGGDVRARRRWLPRLRAPRSRTPGLARSCRTIRAGSRSVRRSRWPSTPERGLSPKFAAYMRNWKRLPVVPEPTA